MPRQTVRFGVALVVVCHPIHLKIQQPFFSDARGGARWRINDERLRFS